MSVEGTVSAERERSDAALTAFVADHYDRLIRLARLVSRDASDAADAVQVALEQAWRRRATLRDEARIQAWLDRIVVREAIRVSRRRQSWLSRLVRPEPDVAWIEPADGRLGDPSTPLALRAAFARISPEQRAVVALHLHAGLQRRGDGGDRRGARGDRPVAAPTRQAAAPPRARGDAVMTSQMADEQLDRELRAFLAWQSDDLAGAPTAGEMALRVGSRVEPGMGMLRPTLRLAWVAAIGLLVMALLWRCPDRGRSRGRRSN